MERRFPLCKRRTLFFLTSLLLVWLLLQHHPQKGTENLISPSPQTVQAMVDRTDTLCRLLVPEATGLRYRGVTDVFAVPDGDRRVLYNVSCLTTDQKEVACFVWDVESKELFSVDRFDLPEETPRWGAEASSPLSPSEERPLVQAAWNWLDALEIAAKSQRWQLVTTPQSVAGSRVVIQVRSEDRKATLRLDKRTKALISLHTHRIR